MTAKWFVDGLKVPCCWRIEKLIVMIAAMKKFLNRDERLVH